MHWESYQSQEDEPKPKHFAPKKRLETLQPKPRPTYKGQSAIPSRKIFGRSGEDTSKGISQLLCMQSYINSVLKISFICVYYCN